MSSVFTWAHTPSLYKKDPAEGEQEEPIEGENKEEEQPDEDSGEEEKEENEPEEENKEPQEEADKKKKVLAFKEAQFYLRVPEPKYNSFKFLETLALSIGMSKIAGKPEDKKLNVYVFSCN